MDPVLLLLEDRLKIKPRRRNVAGLEPERVKASSEVQTGEPVLQKWFLLAFDRKVQCWVSVWRIQLF